MSDTIIRASYETIRPNRYGAAKYRGVIRHDGRVVWECEHLHQFARSTYFNRGDVSAMTCARKAIDRLDEIVPGIAQAVR